MNSKIVQKPAAITLRKLFLGLLFFSLSTAGLHAVKPAVAVGEQHSLFLKSDDTAWGYGHSEFLATNRTLTDQPSPHLCAALS